MRLTRLLRIHVSTIHSAGVVLLAALGYVREWPFVYHCKDAGRTRFVS